MRATGSCQTRARLRSVEQQLPEDRSVRQLPSRPRWPRTVTSTNGPPRCGAATWKPRGRSRTPNSSTACGMARFIGSSCPGTFSRYGAGNRWPESVSWCAVITAWAIRFSSSDFFDRYVKLRIRSACGSSLPCWSQVFMQSNISACILVLHNYSHLARTLKQLCSADYRAARIQAPKRAFSPFRVIMVIMATRSVIFIIVGSFCPTGEPPNEQKVQRLGCAAHRANADRPLNVFYSSKRNTGCSRELFCRHSYRCEQLEHFHGNSG